MTRHQSFIDHRYNLCQGHSRGYKWNGMATNEKLRLLNISDVWQKLHYHCYNLFPFSKNREENSECSGETLVNLASRNHIFMLAKTVSDALQHF